MTYTEKSYEDREWAERMAIYRQSAAAALLARIRDGLFERQGYDEATLRNALLRLATLRGTEVVDDRVPFSTWSFRDRAESVFAGTYRADLARIEGLNVEEQGGFNEKISDSV